VVVVLPWVPAIAISRFSAQSSASRAPRWIGPALAGQGQLRVVGADRGRDDDLGPLGQVGGVVAERRLDPGRAQALHIRGVGAVAAGDGGAEAGADQGQAAHPGAADADEVQPASTPPPSGRTFARIAV